MNIFNLMFYKTFFYFLNDTSCLDLSNFEKLESDDIEEYKQMNSEDFCSCFDDSRIGTKDIVEIKTNKGTIIYHEIEDLEYVKEFLKTNSQVKPCGVFGSHRVGDVYMAGYAENGEIQRFMFTDQDQMVLEGENKTIEEKCGLVFELDQDGLFTEIFNEDDILKYAKEFIPFDFENEEVEILEVNIYVRKEQPTPEVEPLSSILQNDIIKQINLNLDVQQLSEIGMIISKRKKDDKLYIFSMYTEGENHYKLFGDVIENYKNKKEVIDSISKCFNLWANCNYRKNQPYTKLFDACVGVYAFGKKTNALTFFVDNDKPGMVSAMQVKANGKKLPEKKLIKSVYLKYNFEPKDLDAIYNHIVKFL